MLATSSARQADGQRGWQFPSFAGEQAQRGLSLVAVFGYNVPVKRPLLLEPVIALFARQHAQLGECAGAGDGRGRPEIGRQIEYLWDRIHPNHAGYQIRVKLMLPLLGKADKGIP